MIFSERNKIDRLWNSFWSSGISNPLSFVEQFSYLLYIKGLDERDLLEEQKAQHRGEPYSSIFPSLSYRWSVFNKYSAEDLYKTMVEKVFPFIRSYNGDMAASSQFMQDAVLLIKNPLLLHEAVQTIDELPLNDVDAKGDLYEYLLSKLSTAGVNGQFRTPRHIIRMIVEMMEPDISDRICDPACGTAGFLVGAADHILRKYTSEKGVFVDEMGQVHDRIGDLLTREEEANFRTNVFFGNDFDVSMLRISAMNLMLHGIDPINIKYSDTLSNLYLEENKYSIVLANPPFTGSVDLRNIHDSLQQVLKTKKTELLFLLLIHRILEECGRAAVIVPTGVLFGSSKAHRQVREFLIEQNRLDAVINLPSGVFKPYAGVSSAILLFTKGGHTDKVWYYNMEADGFSLDDRRQPIDQNDIPDILATWKYCQIHRSAVPQETDLWFWVEKEQICQAQYDLSLTRYKNVVETEAIEYENYSALLEQIEVIEREILVNIQDLKVMLKNES